MKTTIKTTLFLIGIVLFTTSSIQAKAKQRFMIGGSWGSYNFNNSELGKIDNLIYGSEFADWYFSDSFGLGIRSHKFYQAGSSDYDEEVIIVNFNVALIAILMGSDSDLRLAAYLAYGPGALSYKNDTAGLDFTETADTNSGGLFFDWGGEMFGLRLEYHLVNAKYDFTQGSSSGTIDTSGSAVALGARIAF